MTHKSKRAKYVVSCYCEQDSEYQFDGESRWHWSVALTCDDDDPVYTASNATLRIALREVLDYAYVWKHIRKIRLDVYDSAASKSSRIVRLHSSAPRRKEAEERRKRLVRERRKRALRRARHSRAAELVDRLSCSPSRRDILQFHRLWRTVTGYGARDEALRDILAPAKEALVRMALSAARENGWQHGRAHDPTVRNGYSDVIYVDTPEGQISFHVRPGAHGSLPAYDAPWSGRTDSHLILSRLASAGLIAAAA